MKYVIMDFLMNTKTYCTVFRVDPFKMQEKRSKKIKSAIGILTKWHRNLNQPVSL